MLEHPPCFAVPTPFTRADRIDGPALADCLGLLRGAGVESVIVGGSTGEFPSLTLAERVELLELARRHFPGRILNNISSCAYKEANALARESAAADALLVLPPFYYSDAGPAALAGFFAACLEGSGKPAYLYNFPRHTQTPIAPEALPALRAACPQIVGIKDSGGDLQVSRRYHASGLAVLVGDDGKALEVLRAGLAGSVSGGGGPFPEFLTALAAAWDAGDEALALALQRQFDRWTGLRLSLAGHEIAAVKYVLGLRLGGFPQRVRSPLAELGPGDKAKIEQAFDGLLAAARDAGARLAI